MIKIAITGATGFIGSHVLTELHNQTVEVAAVARFLHDGLRKLVMAGGSNWISPNHLTMYLHY